MTYPFVQAKWFTPGGMKQPRAIVIHMAEGAGTVSWLTHPTNDNSSHFVIELSGRIVQMVRDADASHSLHWDTAHWSASTCGGTFDAAVARTLLGDGASDPNAYIFAVECEGFASSGPNTDQVASLRKLIADLRTRHPSLRGLLGHRDFQGYKACPGCHVFDKFTHGVFDVTPAKITDETPKQITLGVGKKYYDLDGTTVLNSGISTALTWRASPFGVGTKRAMYATVNSIRRVVLVFPTQTRDIPVPVAVPDPTQLAAARTEGFNAAKSRAADHAMAAETAISTMVE